MTLFAKPSRFNPPAMRHPWADKVVYVAQSPALATKLKEVGSVVEMLELEGEGHGIKAEKFLDALAKSRKVFDDHFKKHSRPTR
jgi:dipeptidyl aminopeptidase/acylaminoacyl peptidase